MLYLLLNLDISSLTVGILRSRCIFSLVTYQGAYLRILEFLIGIVEEFLCWNYSLFPIVGSHRIQTGLQFLLHVIFFFRNDVMILAKRII